MRLIKENRLFVVLSLFIILFCVACSHISEKQMLVGRWQYMNVLNADTALFKIADTDYLELNSDSTFNYEIAASHKKNEGSWQYINHQLSLKYKEPDTSRYFDIDIISKRDLIFDEGSKHFILKRLE